MGMIYDLDYPAAPTATAPRVRERKCHPRIETDTPIMPRAVAMSVWAEASAWLNESLPTEWIRRLAVRANVIYAHNPRFRQSLHGRANTGRDYLWAFTRHWLATLIRRHRREWYARLPVIYRVGGDLPARPPGQAFSRRTGRIPVRVTREL